MTASVTFQNWPLFLVGFLQDDLISLVLFSLYLSTVSIFIFTALPWGGVGLHVVQI